MPEHCWLKLSHDMMMEFCVVVLPEENNIGFSYKNTKTCFLRVFSGHILFKRCQHGRGCFSWVKFTVFSFQEDFKSQNDIIAILQYYDALSIEICCFFWKKYFFTCHFLQESHLCSVDPPHLSINTLNFITSASSIRRPVPKAAFVIEKIWHQYKKKTSSVSHQAGRLWLCDVSAQHTFCDLSVMMKGQHVGQGLCD